MSSVLYTEKRRKVATGITKSKTEKGKFKVIARVWPDLKKEATVYGTMDDAIAKRLELKKELLAKKVGIEAAKSSKFRTIGDCLRYYDQEQRTWGDEIFFKLLENFDHVVLEEAWDKLAVYSKYMQNSTNKIGTTYKPATINRHIAMLKGAVSAAYKARKITINYLSGFSTLPELNKKYRTLNCSEIRKLYYELAEHIRPLFFFALTVPCRLGELVNLRKEQYDPVRELIQLRDDETKNGEGRWLPVFNEMKPYFDSIPKECPFLFYMSTGKGYKPLGYWSSKEKRIKPNIQTGWEGACKRAGITDFNFHKTRQQAAMDLLYHDYREFEVMMIGGWKSNEAFRRYVRADEVMLLKRLGKWEIDDSWKSELAPKPVL